MRVKWDSHRARWDGQRGLDGLRDLWTAGWVGGWIWMRGWVGWGGGGLIHPPWARPPRPAPELLGGVLAGWEPGGLVTPSHPAPRLPLPRPAGRGCQSLACPPRCSAPRGRQGGQLAPRLVAPRTERATVPLKFVRCCQDWEDFTLPTWEAMHHL